jgi:protein-S-isoprenylcysteine O-methyltransferase Ste14
MKEKNGEHPLGDAGQLILLGLFAVVWLADSFSLRWSTFLARYVPLGARLSIAAVVMAIALYLVQAGHAVMYQGMRRRGVVTSGAFRYVRHPIYLGSLLFYLALSLATLSLLSCALLIGICFFYDYIARYEERLLVERFGEEYRSYLAKTGKWIPKRGAQRPG